jgi:hypothetical protein
MPKPEEGESMPRRVVPVLTSAWLMLVAVPIPGWSQSPHPVTPGAIPGARRPIPLPIIDACRCSATVFVRAADGGLTQQPQSTFVTDVDESGVPRDTCPSFSRLDVGWHADPHAATGYRYRLDEPDFITVGPGVRSASYDSVPHPPGTNVFTLGVRGPAGTYTDSTRRFQLNYAPDTWWSGPDPNSTSLLTKPNGEKYALLVDGRLQSGILGSLLSADSTQVFPAHRPERRTFFEIWKDTVYVRQEGDTVHMNSWTLFHGGGFDRDSRYAVHVPDAARLLPGFPGGPVLEPGPANGSPIGLRSATSFLLANGNVARFPTSSLYPDYNFNVVPQHHIGWYQGVQYASRAFAVNAAQDGDGTRDMRVPDGVALVQRIENGTATPEEQALRSKVLTFYVDRAPYFLTGNPLFLPTPMQTFAGTHWALNLIADDEDPYSPFMRQVGGPSPNLTLRRMIKVHGKDLQGNDLAYVDPNVYLNQQNITVTVPANLRAGPCVIEVELCDCPTCENVPGSGRCIISQFPVIYRPPGRPGIIAAAATPAGELPAPPVATRTLLLAPFPNPASRGATIRWSLAIGGDVDLEIYNLAGQRVRRLASEPLPAGEHSRIWNGMDDAGQPIGAGLYFIRLRTHETMLTRKVFVAR